MTAGAKIILASASPRRRQLLEQVGIEVIARGVDIDESRKQDEPILSFVQRLALEKALSGCEVIDNPEGLPVLGSDTVVVIGETVLGKPESRIQAKKMLQKLSGKKHTVHTSVAIVIQGKEFIDTSSTEVQFKVLDEFEIDAYLATGEGDDKAGSYAIQGIAAQFIKNINGSFSGVMGLPLFEVVALLNQCGVSPLALRDEHD